MTQRIYIEGDLGVPVNMKLFDADTGDQLMDVVEAKITACATKLTEAKLRRVNSTAWETVTVVSPPPHAMAGRELVEVTLVQQQDQIMNGTRFAAVGSRYTVKDDGTLEHQKLTDCRNEEVAPDSLLASARYPETVLRAHAERVLRGLVQKMIVDSLLAHMFPKFQQGGIVNPAPFPYMPPPSSMVRQAQKAVLKSIMEKSAGVPPSGPAFKESVCPECKGTGQVLLFNRSVPCSKGCKP